MNDQDQDREAEDIKKHRHPAALRLRDESRREKERAAGAAAQLLKRLQEDLGVDDFDAAGASRDEAVAKLDTAIVEYQKWEKRCMEEYKKRLASD